MEITSETLSLETMSKGLLKGDFKFQVKDYSYVAKYMNTPMDGKYTIPLNYESDSNAICAVTMNNNTLTVVISGLQLERGYCPKHFSSKLYPHRFNMSGENNDDFRMLIVPFADMTTNPRNNIRVEFIFDKGKLYSIGFNISEMDNNFHVNETELELYGEIMK